MKVQPLESHSKLLEIQSRLNKYSYLSKEALPGAADALIFQKLKDVNRMPTKEKYFNFYHWYILMAQFAPKEMEQWVKNDHSVENDKLINECLIFLDGQRASPMKTTESPVDYIMNIFLKKPVENNMAVIKNKLLTVNADQLYGEQLKITFKSYQDRVKEYSEDSNQLRIMFRLTPKACEKLKDLVSKWAEVENIQIKKQAKEKRA